nr:unnamed protein product [Digitaria exilis]
MDCNPAAFAYITAVWITLAAWSVYNLLAGTSPSPKSPFNVTLDVLVLLSAAASRLLLVTWRPSLPTAGAHVGDAAVAGRRPRLAGYRWPSAWTTVATGKNQTIWSDEHGDASCTTAVQCVVCLGEVEGGETVMRLPACGHLFHRRCIEMWLHGHSTCPRLNAVSGSGTDGAGLRIF